eukprot:87571-Rhodomonas_salina.1
MLLLSSSIAQLHVPLVPLRVLAHTHTHTHTLPVSTHQPPARDMHAPHREKLWHRSHAYPSGGVEEWNNGTVEEWRRRGVEGVESSEES